MAKKLETRRRTRAVNMNKLYAPVWNTGLYVAVDKDHKKIVGVGHSMDQAVENAKRSGHDDAIISRAPGDQTLKALGTHL